MTTLTNISYLHSRIKQNLETEIVVAGLGYVGNPLAKLLMNHYPRVSGIDPDPKRVDRVGVEGYLNYHYLQSTSVNVVIVCVPTPLSKTHEPDLSYIVSATEDIAKNVLNKARSPVLVVIESTTYPGTTEELILPILQREGVLGKDFFLAYSPERLDPGNEKWNIGNTPKIVSGVTEDCLILVKALYEPVVPIVEVSSPKVAEMTKLLENTFRATNVALVNEIAIVCDKLEINVWEVVKAAATKPFGFMPFRPGPGLGGHCLPVDPQYLAWKLKTLNYNTRFIQTATEINSEMPAYWVSKVQDALNEKQRPIKGERVLVLGVGYKPDTDDIRESPALDIIKLLQDKGAKVEYHDPLVKDLNPLLDLKSRVDSQLEYSSMFDYGAVVLATDHSVYFDQVPGILDTLKYPPAHLCVIDTRGVL